MKRIILNFKENEVLMAEISSGINSSVIRETIHLPLETNLSNGRLYNNNENIAELRNALKSFNYTGSKAELILSFDGMITRTIETPCLNKRDLKSFLDKNMSEYFTISPDEFYFDYKIISMRKEDKKLFDILLAAIPKQKTDDIIALVKACGLTPVRIGIYPDCIYKLFAAEEDKSTAIIDIGRSKSSIVILDRGQLFLYSNIQAEVSAEDYDELADNLGYFLNFYSSRHFGKRVDSLYCIGELSGNEKLISGIKQQFGIVTYDSAALKGIRLSGDTAEISNELMDLSGYLLNTKKIQNKDMDFSEVLKEEKAAARLRINNAPNILAAAIFICTALFICGSLMFVFIENKIYDTAKISSELQSYSATEKQLADLDNAKKDTDKKNNFLKYAENDAFDYKGIMDTIKKGLPENISVSSLVVTNSDVKVTFNIDNSTLDIARLNIALNNMAIFEHEEIVSTVLDDKVRTCTYDLTLKNFKKVSDIQRKK